ncbi:MAG TPA: glutamate 5-kinase [Solirubrobacterales bacterium]|nr:glutamate 5-kinase [Solirubrobacterales bacterium]
MTVVAKLGSSIVAEQSGEVRGDVLDGICSQVGALHAAGEDVVMVTSGAIALGMKLMGFDARPRSVDELQAASAVGQGSLFRAYESRLGAQDVHAAQVLLNSSDVSTRVNYLNARATLRRLLHWRAVPVINENDTTATDEITFGDNDFLAAQVAMLLGARQLVLLTDTAGLHTADPRHHADARLVERVDDFSVLDELEIGDRTSPFGSGGMRSKVAAAGMATQAGVEVVVCDGTLADSLKRAVDGEKVGTLFPAGEGKVPSFKLWLRYAKPARGTVEVDAGAARVLREQGSSLLPVGVVEVGGNFVAGDAIEVVAEGRIVGKGIVNYSSGELARIMGMKSPAVRELMPHAADEVVHRDHFVLGG